MIRRYSTPENVAFYKDRMEECLCRHPDGRRGIVFKVYAARFYDGIRASVAWDSRTGGNPVFGRLDILDFDAY